MGPNKHMRLSELGIKTSFLCPLAQPMQYNTKRRRNKRGVEAQTFGHFTRLGSVRSELVCFHLPSDEDRSKHFQNFWVNLFAHSDGLSCRSSALQLILSAVLWHLVYVI